MKLCKSDTSALIMSEGNKTTCYYNGERLSVYHDGAFNGSYSATATIAEVFESMTALDKASKYAADVQRLENKRINRAMRQ